jgi:hypothetical protein
MSKQVVYIIITGLFKGLMLRTLSLTLIYGDCNAKNMFTFTSCVGFELASPGNKCDLYVSMWKQVEKLADTCKKKSDSFNDV